MNWNTISQWGESEWKELGEHPAHHPECNKPGQAIDEGYSPRLTHSGGRISWLSGQGTFGHQCFTGVRFAKAKTDAGAMEAALERLSKDDDDEARKVLAALTLKQLARIATGRGAQQLRALELISELTQVGMTTTSEPGNCPVGKGEIDCPTCGGRHEPVEVHMSDSLMQSLGDLKQIEANELEGYTPRFKQRRTNGS